MKLEIIKQKLRAIKNDTDASQTIPDLIESLGKLKNAQLLTLFQSGSPTGFVELITKISSDDTALLLLKLIEKLPDNNLHLLFYENYSPLNIFNTNNLIRQINRFSPSVVIKTLHLLQRLRVKEITPLFSSEQDLLTYPFTRKNITVEEQSAVTIALIDALAHSWQLRPLLINAPNDHSEPLLHRMVHCQILPAIAHYLEQPKLKTDHQNAKGETAVKIAENLGHNDTVCLFKTRPFFHILLNPNQKYPVKQFESMANKYPGVLASRWHEHKTLAHIALEQKKPDILALLLRLGADPNAKDEKQLSLLDYAMNSNQTEALRVLATCPKTIFTDIRLDGNLPLPRLFDKCDYPTVAGIIKNLHTNPGVKEANSFAATLMQLPKARLATDELKKELKKTAKQGSLLQILADYCNRTNDILTFFLLHTGSVMSVNRHNTLIQAAQHFVDNHLRMLCKLATEPERESARLQLVMFLFSMTPDALAGFLKSLTLDAEQKTRLDLTLCHALVQPAIYSSLKPCEQLLLIDLLHDQQASLNTIARIHFSQSNLTLLHPQLLQKISQSISREELYQHSKSHLSPSLVVLALSEELSSASPDTDKISELLANLEKKVERFNQDKSSLSLDELHLMLNLATHTRIQNVITKVLSKHAVIRKKIDDLFTRHRNDQPLIPGGLLRKIFMDLANMPANIQSNRKQPALTNLLAIANCEEVHQIINSQQQAARPHLLAASLLACTDTADAYQLSQQMYCLDSKIARQNLTPFVNTAHALGQEARALASMLDNNGQLKNALNSLATAFAKLTEALVASQFENTVPAWTTSLNTALETMQSTCKIADEAMNTDKIRPAPDKPKSLIQQRLIKLIQEQAAHAFPDAVKQTFHKLDEEQKSTDESMHKTLSTNSRLHVLQSVLHSQKNDIHAPAVDKARQYHMSCIKQHIKEFNNSLSKGIALNPASEALLPALTSWQTGQGAFVNQTNLITQMPALITRAQASTLKQIGEQPDNSLQLLQQSAPLLARLQQLANSQSCLNDLLDALYTADIDTLTQFVALTAIAQVHDLNRLGQYILNGKTHHWTVELLKNGVLHGKSPTTWLRHSLESLADFSSGIMSVKALLAGLCIDDNHCEKRLNELSALIKSHKLPLTSEAIILFAKSHAGLLQKDLLSKPSQLFVQTFGELIQQSHASQQHEVFNNLPTGLHNLLLKHTLSGISSSEPIRAAANQTLLTNLCQQASKGSDSQLQIIKKHLGSQDFDMLGDSSLISLAKDVLSEKSGLDDLTFDGIWIQRLLVSPRFVSACPPETLQSLTERYRALSLTLKQDEFERLNDFITGKLSFAMQHRDAMMRWQQALLNNPESRQRLLAKRERLLMFRADDSIRALYNQLEDNCFELRETDADLADKALNNLYAHHNQQLTSMRSDVLFRMADFIYSRAMRGKGDLPKNQNPLLSWLEKYLPHHNFQQAELERKSCVLLYDETGQQIAYVDEANHVKALVNDQPVSLLEVTGWHANSPLYDNNQRRLGILTASGQLKRDNLFQQHTSALLVGKMPIDQLEKSPAALDLLIQDIFIENSLITLYKAADNKEKLAWIQQQVSKHLQESTQTTPVELIESFVAHHSIKSILDTLGNSVNPDNAGRLFMAVLANDSKRKALFANGKSPVLGQFFKLINQEETLANILLEHHSKPWLHEIMGLFARHIPQQGLLGKSLQQLKTRVAKQTLSVTTWDTVIQTLLSNETIAKTVLQEGSDITRFFNKHHITPIIKELNTRKSWNNSSQYRLMVMILKAEHEQLFPNREPNQSEQFVWNSEDLQQITAFATRHVRTRNNFDKDGAIGQRLLGELVFRCANFGQTALFYQTSGKLNTQVAGGHLQRSYLDALAAEYYLVSYAKDMLEQLINTVKNWFGSTDDQDDKYLDEELKDNPAIIDWKALAKASWTHTKSTELPLIAAFLINYSGASTPVYILLEDILNNPALMKNSNILHHIAQIMGHYPHRDISHVIFKALIEAAAHNPELVDKTVLENLAIFHAHAHMPNKDALELLEAKHSLLTHFGQQKNYALSGHIAELLYKKETWKDFFAKWLGFEANDKDEINKLFGRAMTEARIEGELQSNIDRWYFGLQKFLKRWWYYGTGGMTNPTGIIKFCDDESIYTQTWNIPLHVRTPLSGCQVNRTELSYTDDYQETLKHYQAYMDKDSAKDAPKASPPVFDTPGLDKFGFFAKAKEVLETPLPGLTAGLGI